MSTTNHHHENYKEDNEKKRVKVAIVGAGAAGLMCASRLLEDKVVSQDDLILLEARDRLGGRIHTTTETMTPYLATAQSERPPSVNIFRDHGAAWVHGIGCDWSKVKEAASGASTATNTAAESSLDQETSAANLCTNPMMQLLDITELDPIFELGNPWTRPGHVLVDPHKMVLFVNGTQIGGGDEADIGGETTTTNSKNNGDNAIFRNALHRHYDILRKVGQIGYSLISQGDTAKTINQSFQQAVDQVFSTEAEKLKSDTVSSIESDKSIVQTELVAGFYRHLMECWHGTSAPSLQLYFLSAESKDDNPEESEEDYTDEGDYYGPHCTVKHGMQTLLQPLIEAVPSSCIQQNEPVVCIQHQNQSTINVDDNVPVCCLETSSGTIIEADYCVVTVSLGCLAHSVGNAGTNASTSDNETDQNQHELDSKGFIQFTPNFSHEKIDAIQHMEMGSYKKVFLEFDRIFWPRQEPFLGLIRDSNANQEEIPMADEIGNCMLLDNLWARNNLPCLEAVLIGDAGQWATGKSDQVIRNAVLEFLAHAMGMDLEQQLQQWCVDCHVTRWEEDPYSRGAYSGFRLGTLDQHAENLSTSEWNGQLLFGGEATLSGCEGSVHAALLSGENVAKQIEKMMREITK